MSLGVELQKKKVFSVEPIADESSRVFNSSIQPKNSITMANCYIVSSARTPIGNLSGSLASFEASDLGAIVIREVLRRADVDGADVEEIILGQVFTAGAGQNPARKAALKAGVPEATPAWTLNMLCGSGLKSVALGYQSIASGAQQVLICGGQESMTNAPHILNMRDGKKLGSAQLEDSIMKDGLTDVIYNILMGETAENVSKQFSISRSQQDELAVLSQQLTAKSQLDGAFAEDIVGVPVTKRGVTTIIDRDEFPKNDTNVDGLAKLKPCFIRDGTGTVTPGNASGINDAAAVVLLMSEAEVKRRNSKPLARIVGYAQTGVDPKIMGIAPISAITKLLNIVGWTIEEVDLYEINEAFAATSAAVAAQLNIPLSKINVLGGSIALGHPLGASGARVLVTLINALRRNNHKRGVTSLCVGGGMGVAMAIELV